MKLLKNCRRSFAVLAALMITFFASASFAADMIKVTVMVDNSVKKHYNVYALGFSVNGKGQGSLGYSTTKQGPAGGRYSFGFKSLGKNISCGSAVINKSSTVVLSLNKSYQCVSKVYPKR